LGDLDLLGGVLRGVMSSALRDPVYTPEAPLLVPDEGLLAGLRGPVALTGATGFVGSHLAETLHAAGLELKLLVRNPSSARWIDGRIGGIVEGSIEDSSALVKLLDGVRTVFHLAGVLRAPSAAAFMKGNAGGARTLVDAVHAVNPEIVLVHCSSQAAVGPSKEASGASPDIPARPISAYGQSKAAAEEMIRNSGLDWRIVRPPAIYGPRDRDIFEFFRLASGGVMPYPGGERFLSISFVSDVLRVLIRAAGVGRTRGIYHAGPRDVTRMDDMLRLIVDAGDLRARMIPLPEWVLRCAGVGGSTLRVLGMKDIALSRDKVREILARHWILDSRSSLEELGIENGVPLAAGVETTWKWYREIGWLK